MSLHHVVDDLQVSALDVVLANGTMYHATPSKNMHLWRALQVSPLRLAPPEIFTCPPAVTAYCPHGV